MMKLAAAFASFLGVAAMLAPALAVEPFLPKSPRTFAFLDGNGDGKIVLGEIAPRAGKRLLHLDTDGNRAVTVQELDAVMQQGLARRRTRIMAVLDADKDGSITEAELDNFVEAMFNEADTDHDGGVTFEEAQNFKVSAWKRARRAITGAN
jgi:Ca2+-binding EF-hand superfamily protein